MLQTSGYEYCKYGYDYCKYVLVQEHFQSKTFFSIEHTTLKKYTETMLCQNVWRLYVTIFKTFLSFI